LEKKLGLKILILGVIIFFSIFSGCINTDDDLENNVIIKGKDGSYTSIKDAVNNCEDGDIIVVGQGTYKEKITIPKSVTLLGENKEKYNCVINFGSNSCMLPSLLKKRKVSSQ